MSRRIMGQPETIGVLRFSPDGTMLVTGGLNERNFKAPTQVILWEVASGRKVRSWTAEHAVMSLSFSPDGRQVAVADGTKSVRLFAVPSPRRTVTH
jgi:WD40 repeat protein